MPAILFYEASRPYFLSGWAEISHGQAELSGFCTLQLTKLGSLIKPLRYQLEHNVEFADVCFEDRIASILLTRTQNS